MLMKAQVLSEELLDDLTSKEQKESVMQILQAGRKKSAHSSALGKRGATEVAFSPSPPRKNFK